MIDAAKLLVDPGLLLRCGDDPPEPGDEAFDLFFLGFRCQQRQGIAEEECGCFFRDEQVILHLLLRCVVADPAVFLRAVVGQAVCGGFIDFLAEIDQLVVMLSVHMILPVQVYCSCSVSRSVSHFFCFRKYYSRKDNPEQSAAGYADKVWKLKTEKGMSG